MWIRIGLVLGCLFGNSIAQAAGLDSSIGEADARLEELRRLIAEKPDRLRVRLPNSREWQSLESLGLAPTCRAPVLVRLAAPLRAFTQCGGIEVTEEGVRWMTTSIFWTHDRTWEHGRMLHMQVRSFARQSRPTDDVDLRAESPLVKALVDARPVELEKLAELWATLRQQPLPARPDGQWGGSESWPTGLLALHTDGRIKLAGSNLAGLHAWQVWWASQPRTENVTALVGVDLQLGGKSPAFQLGEFTLGQTPFAVVVLPADQQPRDEPALWRDDSWQLLMVRTDGK